MIKYKGYKYEIKLNEDNPESSIGLRYRIKVPNNTITLFGKTIVLTRKFVADGSPEYGHWYASNYQISVNGSWGLPAPEAIGKTHKDIQKKISKWNQRNEAKEAVLRESPQYLDNPDMSTLSSLVDVRDELEDASENQETTSATTTTKTNYFPKPRLYVTNSTKDKEAELQNLAGLVGKIKNLSSDCNITEAIAGIDKYLEGNHDV